MYLRGALPWHRPPPPQGCREHQRSDPVDADARRQGRCGGAALAIAILTPDLKEKFPTLFDASQAAAFMQLAAPELGVASRPASIYEPGKARTLLEFPSKWHLRIALSFGYPADEAKLSAAPKKGGRRTLDEIVHWKKW